MTHDIGPLSIDHKSRVKHDVTTSISAKYPPIYSPLTSSDKTLMKKIENYILLK